jgi:hypothetical protein
VICFAVQAGILVVQSKNVYLCCDPSTVHFVYMLHFAVGYRFIQLEYMSNLYPAESCVIFSEMGVKEHIHSLCRPSTSFHPHSAISALMRTKMLLMKDNGDEV